MLRTHTCGELRADHVGQQVTLCGWVDTYRDHGGQLFADLRDRYGKTQIVFTPERGDETLQQSKALRSEDVVLVRGDVARRPEGTVNPKLETGEVEVRVRHLEILNKSAPPPFQPGSVDLPGEDLRLKYRYIDLRRQKMQQTLLLRHRIIKSMRDYFDEQRFIEVETPMLGRSTPEGARDYLVPSRVVQGHFYALPQSPQLYKQILMVAGYDRYIQVARCFRDEDLRADRQPEFTQLDLEMSFVTAEDIIGVIDGLMARLAKEILGLELKLPLPRMTYDEAMERFGHDAPDLRFGLELVDITDLAREAEFRVFREVAQGGNRVRGMNVKGAASRYSRKDIDELTALIVENFGGQGAGLVQGRRGRHAGLADRQELQPGASGQDCPADGGRAGRFPGLRGRQVRSDLQGPVCLAKTVRRRFEALRSQRDELLLDRRVPHVRLRRGGRAAGPPCTIRSPRRGRRTWPCSRPIPASAGRWPTTW